MSGCDYCEAVKGRVIYSDSSAAVFFPKSASVSGHIVIAPVKHFTIFEQVPDAVVKHMFMIANKVSTILFDSLGVAGTNVIVENGNAAGQKIPHVSINVIPRKENDGLPLQWSPKKIPDPQMSLIEVQLREEASRAVSEPQERPVQVIEEKQEEVIEETEEDYLLKQLERVP